MSAESDNEIPTEFAELKARLRAAWNRTVWTIAWGVALLAFLWAGCEFAAGHKSFPALAAIVCAFGFSYHRLWAYSDSEDWL